MRALIPYILLFRTQLKWMAIGTGLSLLAIASSIGLMSLSGWFISTTGFIATTTYVVASNFNYFYPAAGVRSFSLARIVTRYGERVFTHEATFKILTQVRVWFYQKLEPLAPAHLMKYRSGDLLSRLVNDINALDNLYIRIISPTCVLVLATLSIGLFYSFLSIKIALVTMALTLFAGFAVPFLTGKLAHKHAVDLNIKQSELKTQVVEHIQSMAELKIFAAEQRHLSDIRDSNDAVIARQTKMSTYTGFGAAMMTFFMGLTIWVTLWMSVGLVHDGLLNGAFIALIALGIMALFEAVMPLPTAYQYLGKTMSASQRLNQVIDAQPEVTYVEKSLSVPTQHDIIFDQVKFSYDGHHPVLNDFSMQIGNGEQVAIFAPTGRGKTTLINLLARFWDANSGTIQIGGVNIQNLSENDLREQMTIISQRSHVFNETIRENLLLANPEATDEMLWDALDKVEMKAYVEQLSDGLNTWTGEHGKHLSGGQQKRLALARAFLQQRPILILDEPTEGLDKITEQKVFEQLHLLMQGKTVILITHNKRLLDYVERVVHL